MESRAESSKTWKDRVVLGIDRQAALRRAGAPGPSSDSPAHTRHSLLANATMAPRRAAVRVGRNPSAPTIPATTNSAGRAAASSSASTPAAASMPGARQPVPKPVGKAFIGNHGEARPQAPCLLYQQIDVAVRGERFDLVQERDCVPPDRSCWCRSTRLIRESSHAVAHPPPVLPPRSVSPRHPMDGCEDWRRQEQTVDTVEQPAMSRQKPTGVLNVIAAFHRRFQQIPDLCDDCHHHGR